MESNTSFGSLWRWHDSVEIEFMLNAEVVLGRIEELTTMSVNVMDTWLLMSGDSK